MKKENLPRANEIANDLNMIEHLIEQANAAKLRVEPMILEFEGVDAKSPVNNKPVEINIKDSGIKDMLDSMRSDLNKQYIGCLAKMKQRLESELDNL